jgi:hypothetical protein
LKSDADEHKELDNVTIAVNQAVVNIVVIVAGNAGALTKIVGGHAKRKRFLKTNGD